MNQPAATTAPSFAARSAANAAATPHQRLYIRTLMTQLDLCTRFYGKAHDRFFMAAKLIRPRHGCEIDAALCELTRRQASELARVLHEEVGDE